MNFSVWRMAVILIGYGIAEYLDQRQARKERDTINEYETDGWKQCEGEPEYEEKGNMSRVKLTGQNQIIVTRIAELLRRTP